MSVRSNVLGECLGQILLEKQAHHRARCWPNRSRACRKRSATRGEILVEMGALSPYNLQRALVEQVEAKLFEVFAWRDGKFMFKAGGDAPPARPRASSARRRR